MAVAGLILMIVGGIVGTVGGIWLIIVAFKESVWWGLGSIFVPFVSLIFAITHWAQAKVPFLITVGGLVVLIIGIFMGASSPQVQDLMPVPAP